MYYDISLLRYLTPQINRKKCLLTLTLPQTCFLCAYSRFCCIFLWICGGDSCATVLIVCNSRFNSVDASFYIMFDFCACPTFYNVSYKKFYARNMFASLLVLMGSKNISFVSYAYSINIYLITPLLVNGGLPVKYVYTFQV